LINHTLILSGGLGYGKAESVGLATKRALADAYKNLIHIDRVDGRTISHEIKIRQQKDDIWLCPKPIGYGLRCSYLVQRMCEAFGIKDLAARTYGRRLPHVMLKGLFRGFQQTVLPETRAKALGKKVFDYRRLWRMNDVVRKF